MLSAPGPMDAVTASVARRRGRLGVAGGDVDQGLLVAALDERQGVGVLVQRLAEAGDVAVAEDAQGGGDQPAALAVGHDC
jgi:hypothetical protein